MGKSNSIFLGLFWSLAEKISTKGLTFFISIILARLLLPSDYGAVIVVLMFTSIANIFVENGFRDALIQFRDVDDDDFSTVFWSNFTLSIVVYLILYLIAPYVAIFFDNESLSKILRILAIKVPLSAINTIQTAKVERELDFRKTFNSTLLGTLIEGITGVLLAYNGFGVWALVSVYLISPIINTIVLLITLKWYPKFIFSLCRLKRMLVFSWQMICSSFISGMYSELVTFVLGKYYTFSDLAYYRRGTQFPSFIISNINSSIAAVMFPAISRFSNDIDMVRNMTSKTMRLTAYIIFPMMGGLIACSSSLVEVLLTDKWLECVPFLQIACLSFALQPVQTANCQAIKAVGRSDIMLKMELVKKVQGILFLVIVLKMGVYAVALSVFATVIFSTLVSMYPNKLLIKYGYKDQVLDLLPSFIMTLIMVAVIYPFNYLSIEPIIIMISQILLGIGVYICLSALCRIEEFDILLNKLKNIKS